MIDQIYIEEDLLKHPDFLRLRARFKNADVIPCRRYAEVFNQRSQNFRLQKKKPALILARKHANHVLAAPDGYGIGGHHNYYFSHMLNCLYDCRYCFLQGMYRSANYLLFVNYEDFMDAIRATIQKHRGEDVYFFSGYDCDSLALENLTLFAERFLPFFATEPSGILELRTKSVCTKPFMSVDPIPNVVIAYSMSPAEIAAAHEHGAPTVQARIAAMRKLAQRGWKIGLRFDPVIYHPTFRETYVSLFQDIFDHLSDEAIHSVSFGPMRFPKQMHDAIVKLYPREKLFASPFDLKNKMISYPSAIEDEMMGFLGETLRQYVAPERFFFCLPEENKNG